MSSHPRKFTFRLTPDEFSFLEKKCKEKRCKSLSAFVRWTLLEYHGHSSEELNRQMKKLEWEINKIGTNINQVAKRINSGYTDKQADVVELLSNQERLIILLEEYEKKVEKAWQSQG